MFSIMRSCHENVAKSLHYIKNSETEQNYHPLIRFESKYKSTLISFIILHISRIIMAELSRKTLSDTYSVVFIFL